MESKQLVLVFDAVYRSPPRFARRAAIHRSHTRTLAWFHSFRPDPWRLTRKKRRMCATSRRLLRAQVYYSSTSTCTWWVRWCIMMMTPWTQPRRVERCWRRAVHHDHRSCMADDFHNSARDQKMRACTFGKSIAALPFFLRVTRCAWGVFSIPNLFPWTQTQFFLQKIPRWETFK